MAYNNQGLNLSEAWSETEFDFTEFDLETKYEHPKYV